MTRTTKTWQHLKDVDAGLSDSWLNEVNSLKYWGVQSTCEGHPGPPKQTESDHARVALGMRSPYFDAIVSSIETELANWMRLIASCFRRDDTYGRLRIISSGEETAIEIGQSPPNEHCGEEAVPGLHEQILDVFRDMDRCVLELHHTETRTADVMPSSVASWLDDIAASLRQFDFDCSSLIEE